jgi:hypothetical protein
MPEKAQFLACFKVFIVLLEQVIIKTGILKRLVKAMLLNYL